MRSQQITASRDLLDILLKYADSLGIDKKRLRELRSIDSQQDRIPIQQFNETWKILLKLSGDSNFGLHFGEQSHSLMSKHLLYSVMGSCATIGQAIGKNFQYHNLIINSIQPQLQIQGNQAILTWSQPPTMSKTERHFPESILSLFVTILKWLTDRKIKLEEVRFYHLQPEDISEHQRIFDAPFKFNQDSNQLSFAKTYLELPVFLGNSELLETLENLSQRILNRTYKPETYSDQVVKEIYSVLVQEQKMDIELIAKELAMSPRSLQLKLKKEGHSFRSLLEHVKKETAMVYLNDQTVSICEVAFLLGFSDQSSFNHAFKRWTGRSPGEYRQTDKT